jgi:hypothetical protein
LLIREESIAKSNKSLTKYRNIYFIEFSNSERKVRVQNYKGFCFMKMIPKLRVIGMPALILNQRALQLVADKPLQRLSPELTDS